MYWKLEWFHYLCLISFNNNSHEWNTYMYISMFTTIYLYTDMGSQVLTENNIKSYLEFYNWIEWWNCLSNIVSHIFYIIITIITMIIMHTVLVYYAIFRLFINCVIQKTSECLWIFNLCSELYKHFDLRSKGFTTKFNFTDFFFTEME